MAILDLRFSIFIPRYFPKSPSRSSRSTNEESSKEARFTFFALGLDSAMM